MSALLRRQSSVLAARTVQLRAGSSRVVLRVKRTAKSGAATLLVTCRSVSGDGARKTYRLRLPR